MADVDINALGDQIANLTLKQAKELSDYIKEKYGIEPAAGGGDDDGRPGWRRPVRPRLPSRPSSTSS